MRFRRTRRFHDDFKKLETRDQNYILESFPSLSKALQGDVNLYQKFRIKQMQGWPGIWEGHVKIYLCFTFHYETAEDGEKICFFRRVGTHDIYDNP
jgi:mRNA-degrading endonuclease YafQ of YafQ-DinJ toxin-antitoxin module